MPAKRMVSFWQIFIGIRPSTIWCLPMTRLSMESRRRIDGFGEIFFICLRTIFCGRNILGAVGDPYWLVYSAHYGDSHPSDMRCLFLQPLKHQILWPCRRQSWGPPVNLAFQCIILWRRKRFVGMRCIGQFALQGFQLGKKISLRLPRSSVRQTVGFPLRVGLPSLIYQVLARVHIDMGWAKQRSTYGML